jgi:two-component sensor histidine kinase/CheY-like chemotaxis protein
VYRILYVDDDEILVQLARRVLRRSGYEILHADRPDAALAILGREPVDAIVLDHYLRGGTGHDVLARLRAGGSTVPVVYVTASSDASVAVQALKSGAADYVIKTPGEEFMALLERSIRQSIETARLRYERERANEELRRAKERAESLLAEVNHRVANSLALVTSLLRLQASDSTDEELRRILNETCGRIAAIVNVHRSLYVGEDVHEVEMDRYLAALVADLRLTLPEHVRIVLEAEPIVLRPDQAVSLGVMVTELAVNAAKYAYPDDRPGDVRVLLGHEGPDRVCLTVSDRGIGFDPEGSAIGTGLGRRIVRAMAASLGSDLELATRPDGTQGRVCFRIDPAAASAPPSPETGALASGARRVDLR